MDASLIAIYMNPNFEMDLGLLEGLVRGGGFQLQNQHNGKSTLVDEEGNCCETTASALATRILRKEDTAFQFWQSTWRGECPADLYCSVQFKKEAVVIQFGELPREPTALLRGLWKQCCQRFDDGSMVGLVVDLSGATEDYAEWDALFFGQGIYDGPCPDLLCVQIDREGSLRSECDTHYRGARNSYVAIVAEGVGRMLRPADGGSIWRVGRNPDGPA